MNVKQIIYIPGRCPGTYIQTVQTDKIVSVNPETIQVVRYNPNMRKARANGSSQWIYFWRWDIVPDHMVP